MKFPEKWDFMKHDMFQKDNHIQKEKHNYSCSYFRNIKEMKDSKIIFLSVESSRYRSHKEKKAYNHRIYKGKSEVLSPSLCRRIYRFSVSKKKFTQPKYNSGCEKGSYIYDIEIFNHLY